MCLFSPPPSGTFVFGYHRLFPNKPQLNKMMNVGKACIHVWFSVYLKKFIEHKALYVLKYKTKHLNSTNKVRLWRVTWHVFYILNWTANSLISWHFCLESDKENFKLLEHLDNKILSHYLKFLSALQEQRPPSLYFSCLNLLWWDTRVKVHYWWHSLTLLLYQDALVSMHPR